MRNSRTFYIALLALVIIVGIASCSPTTHYTFRSETYRVIHGDTMWQIAVEYMSKQDKIKDIREMCWEIKQYNRLKDYRVYDGEELLIPLWIKGEN